MKQNYRNGSIVIEYPRDIIYKQNNQFRIQKLTLSSNAAMPIPDAAPVPANPMKCPDPILLANRDAPTFNKNVYLVL